MVKHSEIEELISKYHIPFTYGELEKEIIKNFRGLGYHDIIEKYRYGKENILKLDAELPKPLSESDLNEEFLVENTTFLSQSEKFHSLAKNSSSESKPIFYGHGLKVINLEQGENAVIQFNRKGIFPRIVDAFTLLEAESAFSSIWLNDKGEVKESPQLSHLIPICKTKQKTVRELLSYDFSRSNISNDLRNIILFFVSTNFARYKPYTWKKILDGLETDIYYYIQKAYREYDYFFDKICMALDGIRHFRKPDFYLDLPSTDELELFSATI